jgi:hypothetical protein
MPPARHQYQSPAFWIPGLLKSDLGILIAIAVIVLVYAVDTVTPLGEPVWLLYCIPLVLAYFSNRYYAIPAVVILTVLLIVAGFVASPQGIPVNLAILNRLTFFLLYFAAALILWWVRGRRIRRENL